MLKEKLDIVIISKITKLSKKEIEKIYKYIFVIIRKLE